MDWKDLKVRVVVIILGLSLTAMFGWLVTRASAGDVKALELQHNEEIAEVEGDVEDIKCAVRQIQVTTHHTARAIDRIDRAGGGEGLPPEALKMELLE